MPQNSESRSFHKGGTKLRRDDSLAVVERSGQLTNWAGVDIGVVGAARTVWNTEARHVEALWRAFFEKGGAKVRFYGPGLTGM
jgi:hypothetical protein